MVHTDMPDYPAVLREVARVLRPGYLDHHWNHESWTDRGVRDQVGAMHRPLPSLLNDFVDAGLTLDRFTEGGTPTPVMFAIGTHRAR